MVTAVDTIAFQIAAAPADGMVDVAVFQPRPGVANPRGARPDGMRALLTSAQAREVAALLIAEAAIADAGKPA